MTWSALIDMRGFTLIETLVYLALFTILIGGVVASAYGLFENASRNQTRSMIEEEGAYLIGRINYALSGAKTATGGATLSVTKYDGTTYTISVSGGDFFYSFNSGAAVVLNNSNISVGPLTVTHVSGAVESIQADFTLSAKTSAGQTVSESFTTTRYIRK